MLASQMMSCLPTKSACFRVYSTEGKKPESLRAIGIQRENQACDIFSAAALGAGAVLVVVVSGNAE
jgi:hypothetical protein